MKILCISSSNMVHQPLDESTSYKICQSVVNAVINKVEGDSLQTEIVDLRKAAFNPCIGCGKCYETHRCCCDHSFNGLYEKMIASDAVFIVSPHYAPIPAKLSMILEKMEQITFLHWGANPAYRSEVYGLPTGVISHGGGAGWALQDYQRMVNDTIGNALATIQMKLVPYSEDWKTGISLPLKHAAFMPGRIFPKQEYDWQELDQKIADYVALVIDAV